MQGVPTQAGALFTKIALTPLHQRLLVAHLAAAAVAAHLLEAALPGAGPWFKIGLANIFTLVAFYLLGWRSALAVSLLRVFAGALATGTFLSPTFALSLSGAVGALILLGMIQLAALRLGPVAVSVLASMAHMTAQVVMAYLLIIHHSGILLALPWFLIGSWISGLLNGLLTALILEQLSQHQELLEAT